MLIWTNPISLYFISFSAFVSVLCSWICWDSYLYLTTCTFTSPFKTFNKYLRLLYRIDLDMLVLTENWNNFKDCIQYKTQSYRYKTSFLKIIKTIKILSSIESKKKQHLTEIGIFCNIIKVFNVFKESFHVYVWSKLHYAKIVSYSLKGWHQHFTQNREEMLAHAHSVITACSKHLANQQERDHSQPPIRRQRQLGCCCDWVYTNVGEVLFSASSQGRMTWAGENWHLAEHRKYASGEMEHLVESVGLYKCAKVRSVAS